MDRAYETNFINRAEKLASAIYFITNFFTNEEPVKWRLRELSINLISNSFKDKVSIIKEVSSLFVVAKTNGLVSESNYEILNKELLSLEDLAGIKSPLPLLMPSLAENPRQVKPVESNLLKDNFVKDSVVEKPVLKEFGVVSVKKNNRQSVIINLLKRKKEVMIKDITPLISGCSEKTVQRELSSMVTLGLLKRMGEKRWSRYSLA